MRATINERNGIVILISEDRLEKDQLIRLEYFLNHKRNFISRLFLKTSFCGEESDEVISLRIEF